MVEELKMLIPLLQSAGVGVFWLAIMILVKQLLTTAVMCGTVIYIGSLVVRGVLTHIEANRADMLMSSVSRAILYKYGMCTSDGQLYESHAIALDRALGKAESCK